MDRRLSEVADQHPIQIRDRLLEEAQEIFEEDRKVCRQIGKNGAELLNHNATVLTHCNAGAPGHRGLRHGAGRDLRGS